MDGGSSRDEATEGPQLSNTLSLSFSVSQIRPRLRRMSRSTPTATCLGRPPGGTPVRLPVYLLETFVGTMILEARNEQQIVASPLLSVIHA